MLRAVVNSSNCEDARMRGCLLRKSNSITDMTRKEMSIIRASNGVHSASWVQLYLEEILAAPV
jgi:hypothetical protein